MPDRNITYLVVTAILASPALILSVWLPVRWLRSHSSPERWLGLVACIPLSAVAAHWWWYPSDDLMLHVWLAAVQTLAVLFVAYVSGVLSRRSSGASQRDRDIGLVTAAIGGLCAMLFLTLFGEDGGTLEMLAPAFIANPPGWWRIVGHS